MTRLTPDLDGPVAVYDRSASVWEIFASPAADDYIGCADTLPECRQIVLEWILDVD
jgi:hypothetical protein